MNKTQKDFLKVIAAFLISVIAIAIILPMNIKWLYVALILSGMAGVLQWYWNRLSKN